MLQIGEFSRLGRVSVKTLHYYDEIGLLRPAEVDAWSGYRYYTTAQLFRLQEIVSLKQIGFSISEIRAIVDGAEPDNLLAGKLAELTVEQQQATDRLFRLNHYLKLKQEGFAMTYQVVLKEVPQMTVFSAQAVIPDYESMLKLIPEIGAKIAADNPDVKCTVPEYCCNICHAGECRDHDLEVEVCQAVEAAGVPGDGYTFKDLPAVQVAATLHRGPCDGLGAAYAFLVEWIEANGYRIAGDWREVFIDGIWNTESRSDWLTELQMPVTRI
jgi:DNA-binding transcriptional MerR regulator